MNFELGFYDPVGRYDDLQKAIFLASHHKFSVVSVPLGLFSKAKAFASLDKPAIVPVIDYPFGSSPIPVRLHAILDAANRGATSVDIVVNQSLAINGAWKEFVEDLKTCAAAVKQRKLDARVVIEYRLIDDSDVLYQILTLIFKNSFHSVVTSTQLMADDFIDNLITCKTIQKIGLHAVLASRVIGEESISRARLAEIDAIRFATFEGVRGTLGSY